LLSIKWAMQKCTIQNILIYYFWLFQLYKSVICIEKLDNPEKQETTIQYIDKPLITKAFSYNMSYYKKLYSAALITFLYVWILDGIR